MGTGPSYSNGQLSAHRLLSIRDGLHRRSSRHRTLRQRMSPCQRVTTTSSCRAHRQARCRLAPQIQSYPHWQVVRDCHHGTASDGGSTNAVVHLLEIAGRVEGVNLALAGEALLYLNPL